ncbi:OLC1v1014864C1 [Oldenlandia corymbosa var. corymbosa]|uniref:OLC1v1014864C1 n=1 Tax=Oldenlandia corymbosa var. corymbosa TaxID=529605 RepID=A0AAV1E1X0_OLDCO|nr:OLC1v1014864C1 [Oldenlandia corymbosa var. corymbosa]
MDQQNNNMPVIAKKFWHLVKVLLFMLRKGISKGKLMIDLNMLMKRGKIAGKAIQNLMFHHSHNWASSLAAAAHHHHRRSQDKKNHNLQSLANPNSVEYYEFSCSNSPAYPSFHLPFHLNNKKNKNNHRHQYSGSFSDFFSCNQTPAHGHDDNDVAVQAVFKALELLNSGNVSPALPGFGKSPMVRQLRITDSPFPLKEVEEDNHVDEAAEEFISRFYRDLRRQNGFAS